MRGEDSLAHYDDGQVTFLLGDVRDVLREMPAESVNMCVASPPCGTTALVARRLGRKAIGIDLNAEYLDMAVRRAGGQLAMEMTR